MKILNKLIHVRSTTQKFNLSSQLSLRTLSTQNTSLNGPLIIEYSQLIKGGDYAFEILDKAYSDKGLGTMLVRVQPNDAQNYIKNHQRLAQAMQKLSEMPEEKLRYLEMPELEWGHGWNPGKDGYLEGADTLQASYYANLAQEEYIDHQGKLWKNIWPDNEVKELKEQYLNTGLYVKKVGLKLADCLDKFLTQNVQNYETSIFKALNESPKLAARSIYYRPPNHTSENNLPKNWCSWHKDYSYITGLIPGTFIDKQGKVHEEFNDPEAGLFIQKRDYQILKLDIPRDCIAFQLGELAQVVSGGLLQALPHAVMMTKKRNDLARVSMALFMEPDYSQPIKMPQGTNIDRVLVKQDREHKLSPLEERWQDGMSFGDYYENCRKSFSYAAQIDNKQQQQGM
eukprot:403366914